MTTHFLPFKKCIDTHTLPSQPYLDKAAADKERYEKEKAK
jgi:hypothetical protein